MKRTQRMLALGAIGVLLVTSLLLLSPAPALARSSFHFGLNIGIPVGPYPVYTYPYPAPVYYPPAPAYQVYPRCARVWVPGYYDPYGSWVFGHYRHGCNAWRY